MPREVSLLTYIAMRNRGECLDDVTCPGVVAANQESRARSARLHEAIVALAPLDDATITEQLTLPGVRPGRPYWNDNSDQSRIADRALLAYVRRRGSERCSIERG